MEALIKALGIDLNSPTGYVKIFFAFLIMSFIFNFVKDVLP